MAGKLGHGWFFEEDAHRQLTRQPAAEPRNRLHREQGVAAQRKKIIVNPHLRHVEQFRPDLGDQFFRGRARGCRRCPGIQTDRLRRRQGARVDLPVRAERQQPHPHNRGRQHVLWQPLPQMLAQFQRGRGGAIVADDIRHNALVARRVFPAQDDALAELWMLLEDGLDLAQLNPVTANLLLLVHPPEILDGTIGQVARQVAGPV